MIIRKLFTASVNEFHKYCENDDFIGICYSSINTLRIVFVLCLFYQGDRLTEPVPTPAVCDNKCDSDVDVNEEEWNLITKPDEDGDL